MERLEHVIISTTALGLRVASMNGPVAVAGWRKLAAGTVWLQRWWEGGLQHPPQTTNRPSSLTNLSTKVFKDTVIDNNTVTLSTGRLPARGITIHDSRDLSCT